MKYSILAVVALAACDAQMPSNSPKGECAAAEFQHLVGKDAANLLVLPEPKRSVRPDEAITMDFVPERITVRLDETDVILSLNCG